MLIMGVFQTRSSSFKIYLLFAVGIIYNSSDGIYQQWFFIPNGNCTSKLLVWKPKR